MLLILVPRERRATNRASVKLTMRFIAPMASTPASPNKNALAPKLPLTTA